MLTPGIRSTGGHFFALKKDDNTPYTGIPGSAVISAEAAFDSTYQDTFNPPYNKKVGITLDMNVGGNLDAAHLVYRAAYDPVIARQVYQNISGLGNATLTQCSTTPVPFMTTIFGARTASTTYLAAKGFVQSSPLVNYTSMGAASVEGNIKWDYPGNRHPVNSPFDYDIKPLSGAGGDYWPNADGSNQGFIVTGFTSGSGLKRCVIAELPTKPIQSLGELQNWDLRYENPVPPFSLNIIGNSDATPLIPANAVFNSFNSPKGNEDLQHDDSFCANHILFDDWFVSSIAPNSPDLGKPANPATPQKTYNDLLAGITPLPNRAYHAIVADTAAAATSSSSNFKVDNVDAWKTIASRLEVEGMFNVNSTSVTAWRALLGHARGIKTPYLTATGNQLSDEEDYSFSRFSIAGDTEAKSIGSSGSFSASAEFAGYRKLDDPTLDRFAEEIVKQIRLRGPFLSLSEFVNRQLSSGDLALAGTIQSALNALGKVASVNPYSVIQGGAKLASTDPIPGGNAAGYSFPAAAAGYSVYGLPGWTRQADVIRPIAPILSARDDTFVIRSYGDARDASGNSITATATCEAVVRRVRDYVDPIDAADITTEPTSTANKKFGRRYEIVSFRWLAKEEI